MLPTTPERLPAAATTAAEDDGDDDDIVLNILKNSLSAEALYYVTWFWTMLKNKYIIVHFTKHIMIMF